MNVNLREIPYLLSDEDIKWVDSTIAEMSLEEKIGQLFVNLGHSREESYLKNLVEKYHIGAARYNGASKEEIYNQNKTLQENSKIPLLIACNAEGGGEGACVDGTNVGMPVKIGATNDSHNAYLMGKVAGIEAEAVGCNWTFAPIVDILSNWRNPIISSRCFSNNPQEVLEYAKEYYRGVRENSRLICAMKHFPGDGIDERDQHLSNSVNSLSCEEWDKTYGKVYKGMIDCGIQAVMIGHIMQPAYTRKFNPTIKDEDIMPGTLSKELVTDLLKGQLGFNGLVLTDASHMVGLTCAKKRSEVVPGAIAAGCDLFLFFNDMDEDFGYMLDGYKSGVISQERLYDALRRILGTKAAMGLHKKPKCELVPKVANLSLVGSEEHKQIAKDVADSSITLVKNKQNIFPLSSKKTPRILIVPAKALSGSNFFSLIFSESNKTKPEDVLKAKLEKEGFVVEIYESPIEKISKMTDEAKKASVDAYFIAKTSIDSFVSKYDLIITLANVKGKGQTAERISWSFSKGGGEIPWYVHELPVIVVSLACPFILADVPQAKTYINCYDDTEVTITALVEKFVGRQKFKGVDKIDAFCGMWDTRL